MAKSKHKSKSTRHSASKKKSDRRGVSSRKVEKLSGEESDLYWLPIEMWHEILGFVDKSHHHVIVSVSKKWEKYVNLKRTPPNCSAKLKEAARLNHQWDIMGIEPDKNIKWDWGAIAAASGNHLDLFIKLWDRTMWGPTGIPKIQAAQLPVYMKYENTADTLYDLLERVLRESVQHNASLILTWLKNYFSFPSEMDLVKEGWKGFCVERGGFIETIWKHNCIFLMPIACDVQSHRNAFRGACIGGHLKLAQELYEKYNVRESYGILGDAVIGGNIELYKWVEKLYWQGGHENWADMCLLTTAIESGHLEIAKYLYSNLDDDDDDGPLIECGSSGSRDMVEWAVSEGEEITISHLSDALVVSRDFFDWMSLKFPEARTQFDENWSDEDMATFLDCGLKWIDEELLKKLYNGGVDEEDLEDICNSTGREDLRPLVKSLVGDD